jgi:hypothetical protein
MTLRGRFGIIRSQRKVSGKVMGKYRKGSGDTRKVSDFYQSCIGEGIMPRIY